MRSRHRIVEIEPERAPDPRLIGPCPIDHDDIAVDVVALIDETKAPRPAFPVLPRQAGAAQSNPRQAGRDRPSAVPGERPATARPSLPWGLGTDGWPRHNSRLVRLFACETSEFVGGVAGREWHALELAGHVSVDADDLSASGGWPQLIAGELHMPYLSPPLAVQLRCQPFHARYTRVDIVVVSHCRWPRRFFDVASRCLTEMQLLERPMVGYV